MELIDVVMKLVGPVEPVGETHTDNERFENLGVLTALTDALLTKIDDINTNNSDSHMYSVKRAGKHCADFYDSIGIKGE